MSKHVIEDAKRCLQCKNPMCTRGCPIGTPIREAIHLLLDTQLSTAGEMLFANNPLSLVCSYVCPQENQCEGHCVLGRKGSPVQISAIERYISDYYLNILKPKKSTKEKGKIAIIGSGPAGITISFLLTQKNYDVTIFEGNSDIGGVLRYGIPEFRLPKITLDKLKRVLIDMGVKVKPNVSIGTTITIDDLFRDGFRAIFMGTGVWKPRKLDIKGESLGNVHYAIEYLRNPGAYTLGKKVSIIGAGNVAMDVARTALRKGAEEVYIICNMGEETITASEVEVAYAKIDGAKFMFAKTVTQFTEEGIILADSDAEVTGDSYKVKPAEGTEELFECDSAIIAIGQVPRDVIVSSTTGIEVGRNGLVGVDEFGRTSREGVFASGDVVTGAKIVVEAVKVSKKVAEVMDKYVTEKYGLSGE